MPLDPCTIRCFRSGWQRTTFRRDTNKPPGTLVQVHDDRTTCKLDALPPHTLPVFLPDVLQHVLVSNILEHRELPQ